MENSGIESLVDLIERIEINEENREQIKEIKKFMEEENYVEAIKLLKKLKSEEKIKLKEIKEPKEKVFEEEFIPEDEESEENEQIYPKRLLNKKLEEKYIGLLLENPKAISMYYILHEDCYFQSEEMLNIYKSVLFTEGQAYAPQIAKNEFNFAKEGAETYKRKIELREEAQNGKYDFGIFVYGNGITGGEIYRPEGFENLYAGGDGRNRRGGCGRIWYNKEERFDRFGCISQNGRN